MHPTMDCEGNDEIYHLRNRCYGMEVFMMGWTEPKVKDKDDVESNKPEEDWTETELKLAKFNSRALFAIHASH